MVNTVNLRRDIIQVSGQSWHSTIHHTTPHHTREGPWVSLLIRSSQLTGWLRSQLADVWSIINFFSEGSSNYIHIEQGQSLISQPSLCPKATAYNLPIKQSNFQLQNRVRPGLTNPSQAKIIFSFAQDEESLFHP